MTRRQPADGDVLAEAVTSGADLEALRANLELTPAQRLAELFAMNRFHADVQARTLSPSLRAALEAREIEEAVLRLREMET